MLREARPKGKQSSKNECNMLFLQRRQMLQENAMFRAEVMWHPPHEKVEAIIKLYYLLSSDIPVKDDDVESLASLVLL